MTTDLSRYLLVDVSTGTVLTAQHCVLLHDSDLSSSEWDALDDMGDAEISAIARERGRPLSALARYAPAHL